jgi:hypothetical protein
MGPTRTSSLGGKKYILVIVDDYSRYTWTLLFWEKSDAVVQENSDRDHGREFENARFEDTVTHMAFSKSFLLLLLLNKMGLWSGKTDFYRKWLK